MKRVMIVVNSLSGGGAERSMNILAGSLIERGLTVDLVAVNDGDLDFFAPRCPSHLLGRKWRGGAISTIASGLRLRKLVNELKPDFAIINCELPELLWVFTPNKFKFVMVEHTSKPWRKREPLGLIVRIFLKIKGGSWVSVSPGGKIWPTRQPPDVVIPNPICLPENIDLVKRKSNSSPIRLIFLGRLHEIKQPELFLQVCRVTKMNGIMIGDGPLFNNLIRKVADEGIKVELLGYQKNPWKYISRDDILVVTSSHEGDGMTVLEGLKFGMNLILLNNVDLRRVGLPLYNYADSIEEFEEKCLKHKDGTKSLAIKESMKTSLLSPRDLDKITNAWIEYLSFL